MIGELPKALEVNGKLLPINADFRAVLQLFPMYDDPELSDDEKAYVTCKNLYACDIDIEDFAEATQKAYWFIDGGEMPKSEPTKARILDWKKDEHIMMPAISKTVSVPDIRSLPFLHWWTFLGAFGEVGEGLFSYVLNLRRKQAEGEKLEEMEKEFIRKNADLIELRTPEDEKALKELNDFLDTIT